MKNLNNRPVRLSLIAVSFCFFAIRTTLLPYYEVSSFSMLPLPSLPITLSQRIIRSTVSLDAVADDGSSSDGPRSSPIVSATWGLKNNFELFLTQCSIQSFCFLAKSLRDPQTALWVEKFTQPSIKKRKIKKESNPQASLPSEAQAEKQEEKSQAQPVGDAMLDAALEASSTTASDPSPDPNPDSKESKVGGRPSNNDKDWDGTGTLGSSIKSELLTYHGLAALNTTVFPSWDTYFSTLLEEPSETLTVESDRAWVPTYDVEINPASLCARIISVREQIAREFVLDLDAVATMGGYTLESYHQALRGQQGKGEGEEDVSSGKQDEAIKVERPNLLFLDYEPDQETQYRPSPLRRGNFDLLVLLATQEAIHRILNNDEHVENGVHHFLRNFYASRLSTHFTGRVPYGRADSFLEALLSAPPSRTQLPGDSGFADDGTVRWTLIDPMRIAELILQEREQVALDWKELAKNVPNEHVYIKRLQLNKLMGIPNVPQGENGEE